LKNSLYYRTKREKRVGKIKGFPWREFEKNPKIFGKNELFWGVGNERKMKNFLKIPVHFALSSVEGSGRDFSKMPPQSWQKNIFLRRGGKAGSKALWKRLVSERRQKPPPRPIYQRKPKRPEKFVVWIAAGVGRNRFCGTEGIERG